MGKVVIVTGASGGLGGETAVQFGLTGARGLVHYHSSRPAADVTGGALMLPATIADSSRVPNVKIPRRLTGCFSMVEPDYT